MKEPEVFVHSVFYSLQGEGPKAGVPSVFLRLAGCNLRCSYCDTPEALERGRKISVVKLKEEILSLSDRAQNLVITGGEPLLQSRGLGILIEEVLPHFPSVEVETNGTLPPLKINPGVFYNVSPKLSNSGMSRDTGLRLKVLREFLPLPSIFKFVVVNREDVEEVSELVRKLEIPASRVFLMPQAKGLKELEERAKQVALLALEYGFSYSDRLHLRLSLP